MLQIVARCVLLMTSVVLAHERENGILYKNEAMGIRPFQTATNVQSVDYPSPAPHDLIQTWRFLAYTDDQKSKTLRLRCSRISIPKTSGNGCGEYTLELKDGDKVRHFCGEVAPFDIMTETENIYLTLKTGPRGGAVVDCKVQAIYLDQNGQEITTTTTTTPKPTRPSYLEMESREFDSSEHGVTMGQKLTSCDCGWANKAMSRIVNGSETNPNEYPFAVGLIYYGLPKSRFCGATIVTKWHVLTAAHCTDSKETTRLGVLVGAHNIFSKELPDTAAMYQVERKVQHTGYISGIWKNDISLLVLKEPIRFSRFVGPACLPTRKLTLDRQFIKIIGWGAEVFFGKQSDYLQDVDVRAVPMKECNYAYSDVDYKHPTQLCTYADKKASCQGDSGGPVMWVDPETNRYTHVGIVSFGRICGDLSPSVHSDVSAYINWISHYVKATKPYAEICTKID